MRYQAKAMQSKAGHFAVFIGKKYFVNTVTTDEREAKITALQMSGQWHQAQIDKIDAMLDKLGALDHDDPHGYLA